MIGGWLEQKSGYAQDASSHRLPPAPVESAQFGDGDDHLQLDAGQFPGRRGLRASRLRQRPLSRLHPDQTATHPPLLRSGLKGQAVDLYMYNNTIYNTLVSPLTNQFASGVQINAESTPTRAAKAR